MGGSLWGHIDEGLAFIFMGLWWMYNLFKRYLQAGGTERYETEISFCLNIRGRQVNFEIYAKIIVSILGFLIEVFNGGGNVRFLDDNGNFYRVTSLQHMSIYTLFILHGVIDLLRYKKILIVDGLEYLTLFFTFIWYGMIFYFHTAHTDKLETMIHALGIVWCWGAAISILWEHRSVDKFLPNYCRSLMVLSLGTWFFHTPFVLFDSAGFPGDNPNPKWNRDDDTNSQFIATMFGFHVFTNVTLSLVMFAMMRLVYRRKSGGVNSHVMFQRLPTKESDLEEKASLMDEEL